VFGRRSLHSYLTPGPCICSGLLIKAVQPRIKHEQSSDTLDDLSQMVFLLRALQEINVTKEGAM